MENIANSLKSLERLSMEPRVDFLGSQVRIGDFFVIQNPEYCSNSIACAAKCIGITPKGLFMEWKIDKFMNTKISGLVSFDKIHGRIPAVIDWNSNPIKNFIFIFCLAIIAFTFYCAKYMGPN